MLTQISASLKTGTNAIDGGTFQKFRKANFLGYQGKFALICNPLAYTELKNSATWQAIWQNAENRGRTNPIWDGMVGKYVVGVYDNIVLMESDRQPFATDGGSGSVNYSRGILLGAQGQTQQNTVYRSS